MICCVGVRDSRTSSRTDRAHEVDHGGAVAHRCHDGPALGNRSSKEEVPPGGVCATSLVRGQERPRARSPGPEHSGSSWRSTPPGGSHALSWHRRSLKGKCMVLVGRSRGVRRVALFEGVDCTDGDGPRGACAMSGCSVRGVLGPMDMTGAPAQTPQREFPFPFPSALKLDGKRYREFVRRGRAGRGRTRRGRGRRPGGPRGCRSGWRCAGGRCRGARGGSAARGRQRGRRGSAPLA